MKPANSIFIRIYSSFAFFLSLLIRRSFSEGLFFFFPPALIPLLPRCNELCVSPPEQLVPQLTLRWKLEKSWHSYHLDSQFTRLWLRQPAGRDLMLKTHTALSDAQYPGSQTCSALRGMWSCCSYEQAKLALFFCSILSRSITVHYIW